jgi:hypothetical protein
MMCAALLRLRRRPRGGRIDLAAPGGTLGLAFVDLAWVASDGGSAELALTAGTGRAVQLPPDMFLSLPWEQLVDGLYEDSRGDRPQLTGIEGDGETFVSLFPSGEWEAARVFRTRREPGGRTVAAKVEFRVPGQLLPGSDPGLLLPVVRLCLPPLGDWT